MMFISSSDVPLVNAKLPSKGWLSAKRVELSETKEPEKVIVCEREDASEERRCRSDWLNKRKKSEPICRPKPRKRVYISA